MIAWRSKHVVCNHLVILYYNNIILLRWRPLFCTTNKRAYREVLRYRFHISNYTKHNKGTGLFGGRLSHAIHRLYAYLHPLVYNYVLQLPVLQSRPLQAYLQKDHRKYWWYPVFIKVLWNEIWQELQNVILWHKSLYNCPNAHSGKDRRRWSTFN